MLTGKIKFFNAKSKFGFIVEEKTGQEYYVHIKELKEPLVAGNKVVFSIKEEKRGPVAVKVSKAEQ